MIQFATSENGPTDLPIKLNDGGLPVADAGLAAMHASRQRAIVDQVRKAVLAEELGFHYYFLTEHHFQAEGAEFSPNPLLVQAAAALQTKRIRLGQLANILSWHHPVRLAEQAAIVDVLSGGRLEFGIGRGGQPREFEVFSQAYGSSSTDEQRNRLYFEECMEIIIKAWTEPSFSYHGEFFSIPPKYTPHHHPMTIGYFSEPGVGRGVDDILALGEPTGLPGVRSHSTMLKEISVLPQPLQKPYPQIWQPVVRSELSMRVAARHGYNIAFVTGDLDGVQKDVDIYYEEAEKHGWPDRLDRGKFKYGWDCARNRGVYHAVNMHIVDHGVGNAAKYLLGMRHLSSYLGGGGGVGQGGNRGEGQPTGGHKRALFCGSADEIIEGLMMVKENGRYDDFLCSVGFHAAGLTWEENEEQMRAFAADVMPVLARECGGAAPMAEPVADVVL